MDSETTLVALEDAATVVLLRDTPEGPKVLMLERPAQRGSFAGAWVFPGGKVDPGDRVDGGDVAAARTAGVREVAEETGQILEEGTLAPLSMWLPMRALPRRFRTWFFLAGAASAQVVLNPGEHGSYSWLTPGRALELHAAGDMLLVPPTWVTLHHLRPFESVDDALQAARNHEAVKYLSYLLPDNSNGELTGPRTAGGGGIAVWAGDEAYPGGGDSAPAGGRHRLTMAALPWVYERTEASVPRAATAQ